MKKKDGKTVIWAIDPFDVNIKWRKKSLQLFCRQVKRAKLSLQPVYVAWPDRNGRVINMQEMQDFLDNFLRKAGISDYKEPKIIFSFGGDKAAGVNELIRYARRQNTAWVALSSHGRTALGRALFGSFAEKLLSNSPWPILSLSQEGSLAFKNPVRRALFPTDFSPQSHASFKRFLETAGDMKLDIVLFHYVWYPIPGAYVDLPAAAVPDTYFSEQESYAKKQANKWIGEAKSQGIRVSLQIKSSGYSAISSKDILQAARKVGADIVAMAATSKPFDRLFFGSAAYETLRANVMPVWLFGPKAAKRLHRLRKKKRARRRTQASRRSTSVAAVHA